VLISSVVRPANAPAAQFIDITGRTVPIGLAGRLASVQLFLERGF
jgi:hypothetical protein